MPTEEQLNNGFEIGEWEVLPARGVLRSGDKEERPEPRVFGVLMALARRDGDLVTRDELIDELWDGRPTSDEPINRCLSQLRGHLGDRDKPHRYIETLTRRGYRLKQKVRLRDSTTSVPAAAPAKRNAWTYGVALVVLGLIATAVWRGTMDTGDTPIRSIGVLPFDNLSPGTDEYLVSGFKEELVQTLQNIPDLAVKSGRITYPDEEVRGIARILDVDAVLFGAAQRNGDILKISYQVANAGTGINLSSGSITGRVEDIFALQERLAVMVRDDLFGESPRQLVSSSRPANFDAYDTYMRGLYEFERRGPPGNLEAAIRLFNRTIELDRQFGPAYLSLATAYALLPAYRNAPVTETHAMAIDVVEQGIAVDDSIRDAAGAVFGFVYHQQKQWSLSEQAYMRATEAKVVDSNAFNWYSRMLASVGRLDAALGKALEAREIDPSSAIINSRVAIAYTWLGDSALAAEFFERANRLGAGGTTHLLANALLLVRDGRLDEAYDLTVTGVTMSGLSIDWIDPVFTGFEDNSQRDTALEAIDTASAHGQLDPQIEVTVRTMLGDLDGAMQIARRLESPGEIFEMDLLFIPELRPLRELPEFSELMDALHITAYWKEKGCRLEQLNVRCPQD